MWEAVVVGLIVAAATGYAAWALCPAATRLRLARRLAGRVRRAGRPAWLMSATAALERGAARRLGACSDCGPVQPKQPARRGTRKS